MPKKATLTHSVCALAAFILFGCVGPRLPSYQTKTQSFSWGKAHVWMQQISGTRRDAETGQGFLLMDVVYKTKYRDKGCALTVEDVSLKDPETGEYLMRDTPTYSDGSPMTRQIREYRSGQFHMSKLVFDFEKAHLPYDLDIRLTLDCDGSETEHLFSRPLAFKMVQPVIWEQ